MDTSLENRIKQYALSEGFDLVGITGPSAPENHAPFLKEFIRLDYHGTMDWLADRQHHRAGPTGLWPDCQSVIMLAMNYGPDFDPLDQLKAKDRAAISVYAQGDDYHDVIKKRMKAIARWLVDETGCTLKVFVDTAPVPEKRLAELAGLGWQGKHTNMVSRDFGSWLFLGAIYTDLALSPNTPEDDHCGNCRACLDVCPTDAFPRPYQLDARKCLSYLTIEHKGSWPEVYRRAMGNRIYGCDDCLAVCPWNKFASVTNKAKLAARDALVSPKLVDLLTFDDAGFRAHFSKNPIKRIGLKRFQRNVLYALGNSGDASALPVIEPFLTDDDPVVRDAAKWATHQLIGYQK